ncbi:pyruvate, water dikinase [Sinosporangium album]|uniref:Pyruvate, water dikinase n=1 Tax=Sinosporangium album TaxID=504805 RepID=A0A1G8B708_9ACTN|nr:PEP-utilizing enzyme [Sinosporangium album]SDH29032.1 pyruvate, water dikinase [Sinosporangium album]
MGSFPVFDGASKVFPIYSRANIGEIFPDPISPLNASAGFQANLEPGWRAAFVSCGVWDHDLYDATVEHNIVPAFGGYLYINMSLMRLFGVRVPGATPGSVDLQYFGDMPGIPSYESERRDFDENPAYSEKAGAWLAHEVLGATDLAAYDADRRTVAGIRARRPDLASLSDRELRQRITSFGDVLQGVFERHISASLKSGIGLGGIARITEAAGRPDLALTLVSGIGEVDSAEPSTQMWHLSRLARTGPVAAHFDAGGRDLFERLGADPETRDFADALDRFLRTWDFRGPSEWEIRATTWGTDPALVLATVDRLRLVSEDEAPARKNAERARQRQAASAELRTLFAGDETAVAQFDAVLHAAELWLRGRERGRTTAAMLIHEVRLAARELGRRAAEAGHLDHVAQIFMLFAGELDTWLDDPAAHLDILRERERTYLRLFDYEPPFVTVGRPGPVAEWRRRSDRSAAPLRPGDAITGVPGCGGTARGRARVLTAPDDPSALEPGDILVAPITDPSWTPLFVAAAAVVVDVGAPFSHAAIISRELGIPCVVSATDATARIPDGALIEVDGTTAAVTVLEVVDVTAAVTAAEAEGAP